MQTENHISNVQFYTNITNHDNVILLFHIEYMFMNPNSYFNVIRVTILVRLSNRSFSAPSVVAGRAEPTPDRPYLAPYSDGLEGNLVGPAASKVPMGMDSLTLIVFGEF